MKKSKIEKKKLETNVQKIDVCMVKNGSLMNAVNYCNVNMLKCIGFNESTNRSDWLSFQRRVLIWDISVNFNNCRSLCVYSNEMKWIQKCITKCFIYFFLYVYILFIKRLNMRTSNRCVFHVVHMDMNISHPNSREVYLEWLQRHVQMLNGLRKPRRFSVILAKNNVNQF